MIELEVNISQAIRSIIPSSDTSTSRGAGSGRCPRNERECENIIRRNSDSLMSNGSLYLGGHF